jgi:hypothetical protein
MITPRRFFAESQYRFLRRLASQRYLAILEKAARFRAMAPLLPTSTALGVKWRDWCSRRRLIALKDAGQPKVSVIIPAFNASMTIERCLLSLQAQTYPYWRALVVDDASTDETAAIIARVAASDERIELIRNETRRGVAYSRNRGLAQAATEYATFLDADDTSLPERLEKQLSCLVAKPNLVFSTCRYVRIDEESSPVFVNGELDRKLLISMLFRRGSILQRVGFFRDLLIGEDSEYFTRICAAFGNDSEAHIPEVLYLAGFSPTSLMFSGTEVEFVAPNHIRHVPSEGARQQLEAAIENIETLRIQGNSLFLERWE